jgi:hypothetical protein
LPEQQIDSIFKSIQVSEKDWVISLSIEQAGTIPIIDSLGNILHEDPEGTFMLFKIGENYFLQKLDLEFPDGYLTSKVVISKCLKLGENTSMNYNVDSILLAKKEWIYPFIYRDSSTNAYNIQPPADHEPYYAMHFKTTKTDGSDVFFTETSWAKSEEFLNSENLNYLYNTNTFIYRSFSKLIVVIKNNMKNLNAHKQLSHATYQSKIFNFFNTQILYVHISKYKKIIITYF